MLFMVLRCKCLTLQNHQRSLFYVDSNEQTILPIGLPVGHLYDKVLDSDVGVLRKMFLKKKLKEERDLSLTKRMFGMCSSVSDTK